MFLGKKPALPARVRDVKWTLAPGKVRQCWWSCVVIPYWIEEKLKKKAKKKESKP